MVTPVVCSCNCVDGQIFVVRFSPCIQPVAQAGRPQKWPNAEQALWKDQNVRLPWSHKSEQISIRLRYFLGKKHPEFGGGAWCSGKCGARTGLTLTESVKGVVRGREGGLGGVWRREARARCT